MFCCGTVVDKLVLLNWFIRSLFRANFQFANRYCVKLNSIQGVQPIPSNTILFFTELTNTIFIGLIRSYLQVLNITSWYLMGYCIISKNVYLSINVYNIKFKSSSSQHLLLSQHTQQSPTLHLIHRGSMSFTERSSSSVKSRASSKAFLNKGRGWDVRKRHNAFIMYCMWIARVNVNHI